MTANFYQKAGIDDSAHESELSFHFVKTDFDEPNFSGAPRHKEGLVIGFVDGHSKYFKQNATLAAGEKSPYRFPYDLHGVPKIK